MGRKLVLVVSAFIMAFVSLHDAAAQARLMTKKFKLSDFTTKTTKVVMSGGEDILQMTFKEEVRKRWRISPFEFCSVDEFEKLKSDPDYYFLMCAPEEGNASMLVISLFHGGAKSDPDPTKEAFPIVDLPVESLESPSGRGIAFMPAAIDIVQDFVQRSMMSDSVTYKGLKTYNNGLPKLQGKTVLICREYVSESDRESLSQYAPGVRLVSGEEADMAMLFGRQNTIVTFIVGPDSPTFGDRIYKMAVDANTHELYMFVKTRVMHRGNAVFSAKELRSLIKAGR